MILNAAESGECDQEVKVSKHFVAAVLAGVVLSVSGMGQTQQPQTASPNPPQRLEPAKQIAQDLNEMDSLLNNMAAETTFVKDTNLQILLNSNYRLWSILLRDLRLQMELQKKTDGQNSGSGESR
jgi:hypothetical protein